VSVESDLLPTACQAFFASASALLPPFSSSASARLPPPFSSASSSALPPPASADRPSWRAAIHSFPHDRGGKAPVNESTLSLASASVAVVLARAAVDRVPAELALRGHF